MQEQNLKIPFSKRQENIELLRKKLANEGEQENQQLKSLWHQKNALILQQENAIKRQYNLLLPFLSLTTELIMFLVLIWFAPLKELLTEPLIKYLTIGAGILFTTDEILNVKTFIQNLAKRDLALKNIPNSPEVLALEEQISAENEKLQKNMASRVLVQEEIMALNKEAKPLVEGQIATLTRPAKLIRKRQR